MYFQLVGDKSKCSQPKRFCTPRRTLGVNIFTILFLVHIVGIDGLETLDIRYTKQAGKDWKPLHQLCRCLTKGPAPVRPLLDKTGMRPYTTKDWTEILAEHLKEQFTSHPASDSYAIIAPQEEVERRVREFLLAPTPSLPGDYYVFPAETARTILCLPKRKAPGPDGIPTIATKQLPRRAMVAMTRLFNGILRMGHFPGCWKMGRVIAIRRQAKIFVLHQVSARLHCCPTSPNCLSASCCDACTVT
ncbi:Probable RNA-directed DNA polymerase from transposon X-element [Eumeta japonica]|uniref:Probable RNA-directed DNA polymerase from transposon X-element n=1 Tax=Eumeta variegata TaxID=151549 RepID=A0A4C1SDB3_EUMVA|nr:Probable RNA-directed DNA polymerase from transposon X-element [Eumeta japonica]